MEQLEWTPLHKAAIHGDSETARLLLNAKAHVNARDKVSMCGRGGGCMGGLCRVGCVITTCIYVCVYKCIYVYLYTCICMHMHT